MLPWMSRGMVQQSNPLPWSWLFAFDLSFLGKWDAAMPHGILSINGSDLLTEYHRITTAGLDAARTNARVIQHSTAMYHTLRKSITIDPSLSSTFGNLPAHEDGPSLFKELTGFTVVVSLQLPIVSQHQLLEFDPAAYKFHLSDINTKLSHLFVLASTPCIC